MKKWELSFPDKKIISNLMLKCGVSSLTAAVLASRGYSSPEAVMNAYEISELSDPFLIKDMQAAADAINEAVENGDKICVYGDYDCDGIMAAVMLYSYLLEIGADAVYYIPERAEGYGLNKDAVKSLCESGVQLIVTVDNGIAAVEESELIYQCGMKLVVTDHHQPGEALPHAEAVVDPHRNDCCSPFKYLCGAGVVLKLIAALDGGDYTMALEQFGDLAAIATIADIVSLTGENRFIVSYGMNLIENTDRPSLEALKEVCGLNDKELDSDSIGFGIAPRINAAGRFGSPRTAAELFLCEEPDKAADLAEELNRLNTERKNTETEIIKEIHSMIDENPMLIRERVIFLYGKNWHHGVIGIVASKITEQFGKPCFIASESSGEIRGSARSFGDFSVFEALKYCSDSLEKFGGHPGAGGFTIKSGMADEFNRLIQEFALKYHRNMPDFIIRPDAAVSPMELQLHNINGLKLLEPFGCQNEKPLFYLKNALVTDVVPIKDGLHSKLRLKYGTVYMNAFLFRVSPDELKIAKNETCDFIVTLDVYSFKGNEYISAVIKDYNKNSEEINAVCADSKLFEAILRGEDIPTADCRRILPVRDETAAIYKRIPDEGISSDALFSKMKQDIINYGKYLVSLEAMRQLGLIAYSSSNDRITRCPVRSKVDLLSAPILTELNRKATGTR
ncbi:MAG: single-stranded-DNA-specific exonuclease RecJ [Ruminococcus sp.]|nr:single-stranded-DNA-specific exonuclease RecJ [Ruminococcus sp.]